MGRQLIPAAADRTTFGHLQGRLDARARALVYARLAQMSVALLVIAVPSFRHALNIPFPGALYGYLALLAGHVLSTLWLGRPYGRTVIFVTLCFDLAALVYAVAASGGLKSPLLPTQLVFTMLFAMLFPSPLAIIPPLLTLPIVAWLDQVLGAPRLPEAVLLLIWYASLNIVVVYFVVYLENREQHALRQVFGLQRQRRERALASQRSRIAREIHDGVGAALSGIVLQAEYLGSRVEEGPLRREIEELREAASEGMEELRRAVSILRREFQLATALPSYAQAFGLRHRLAVHTEVTGREIELDAETALALFRVAQEALSNVAQHAQAQQVRIELVFDRTQVAVRVIDDGQGFDAAARLGGHYGLRNMSERTRRLGGELRVESQPGRGTRIEAVVPGPVPAAAELEIALLGERNTAETTHA